MKGAASPLSFSNPSSRYKRAVDKCRALEKTAAAGRPVDPAEFPVAPAGFGAPVAAAAPPPPAPRQEAPPTPPAAAPQQAPEEPLDPKLQHVKALLTRR